LRILLVNPRAQNSHKRLPLSILFLSRVIPEEIECCLVDGNIDPDAQLRAEAFISRSPSVTWVLITVMPGPQLRWAYPWCQQLKKRWPNIKIIWGGYFPSVYTEVTCRDSNVDFVVFGQGESVLEDLIKRVTKNEEYLSLPGICYIDENDRFIQNAPPRMKRSDQYGRAPYGRLNMAQYAAKTFLGSRTFNHHSSVGCPYVCNFCAVTNVANGRWLADKADSVVGEITHLVQEYGANAIEFHDNNFFAAEKRCFEISEGLKGLNINWWGEGRIDTLLKFSDETWSSMSQSGLKMVFLGAESGDDETLEAMDKGGLKVEDTLMLNRRMKTYGVVPEFSFVLGNAVNPEKDVRVTLDLIRQLKSDNPSCEIILYIYTPVPLPGMYDDAVAMGFSFPETLEEWTNSEWQSYEDRRHATTPWMSRKLVNKIYDFEAVLHAKWPSNSDLNLSKNQRKILSLLAKPRFRFKWYTRPLLIRCLQRYWGYRRPEEMGF
jgi:anaerobic magnesium-protoporphyrin IX monomethyl ester cyclase